MREYKEESKEEFKFLVITDPLVMGSCIDYPAQATDPWLG